MFLRNNVIILLTACPGLDQRMTVGSYLSLAYIDILCLRDVFDGVIKLGHACAELVSFIYIDESRD